MNEQELREKIVKVLEEYRDWFIEEDYKRDIAKIDYTGIADALIAAGIGDVSEYKEKLKLHRVFVRKDGGDIKVLYGNNEVDEIVKERNEYKHRAEVAEMALQYAVSEYRCDECPCFDCNAEIRGSQECIDCICEEYKKQAEKELAEEKNEQV